MKTTTVYINFIGKGCLMQASISQRRVGQLLNSLSLAPNQVRLDTSKGKVIDLDQLLDQYPWLTISIKADVVVSDDTDAAIAAVFQPAECCGDIKPPPIKPVAEPLPEAPKEEPFTEIPLELQNFMTLGPIQFVRDRDAPSCVISQLQRLQQQNRPF